MDSWNGTCDGAPWEVEVDADCFAEGEPFVMSLSVDDSDEAAESLAALSAKQARELAVALIKWADVVDENNVRVWGTKTPAGA